MLRDGVIRASVLAVVLAAIPAAQATVVIEPDEGWQGYFLWENRSDNGTLIDGISETPYYYNDQENWSREHKDWSLTLLQSRLLPYIEIWDNYDIPGDVYALLVDGVVVPPTSAYLVDVDPYDLFYWEYRDLPLTAGTHIITIDVTATGGPNIHRGSGHALFSPAGDVIPAPGAILLGALGAVMVGWLRRRRTL